MVSRARRASHLGRVAARIALAWALGALLAACGNSVSSTPSTTPTATTIASAPPCQATQLATAVARTGAAATHILTDLSLQNNSRQTCSLDGYPRLQLLDANGHALPTHVTNATSAYLFYNLQPGVVVLSPGATAHFILQWSEIDSSGACANPTVSSSLEITPPGSAVPMTFLIQLRPCDGDLITSPIVASS